MTGEQNLHELMPDLRGKLRDEVSLSDVTWFRVGGAARYFFSPADQDDLVYFLNRCPPNIETTVLGAGSNVLVRDGGIDGVVIKLGKAFAGISVDEQNRLSVGAAALDVNVARVAAKQKLSGVEFYAGIPGSIGGALQMNAGAYGGETADCFLLAQGVDHKGRLHHFTKDDMGFAYRRNNVAKEIIFLSAIYQLRAGESSEIEQKMTAITRAREGSQPIRSRTGGSTFRNPGGAHADAPKAWKLIAAAGCRGLREGDAQVSEQHCNFLINHGAASATDLETLGETIRQRVRVQAGIDLHWEIKRLGQLGQAMEKQL